jgi:acetyl-CoA acyltransferase
VRDAVIVDAVRSPIGKRNGALSGLHAVDLSASVLAALLARNGLEPTAVEDVIWGCVSQVGEQAGNVARLGVLAAGWPETVPGTTIDRACGSSQQAAHFAAAAVIAGQYDIVIAGGVETMSRVPLGSARRTGPGLPYGSKVRRRYADVLGDDGEFSQGLGAEAIAERWGLSRQQLDEHSLLSHSKAAVATDSGAFAAEIVPMTIEGDGEDRPVSHDEGVRRGGTLESMANLTPAFLPEGGVVTAGNASQISDGASALLVMTSAKAAELGLPPIARFHSFATVGVDPITMLTGPIPATAAVLRRANLAIEDIDVFEVNEAFASVTCAWLSTTGAKEERLNPNGGAIALGHPLGASGTRLMTTLVHRMRREGLRYGLQTMCEGGGMANATILELAS